MSRYIPLALSLFIGACPAFAEPPQLNTNYAEPEETVWAESNYTLPPFPKDENLAEFSVGGVSATKYYVDKTAIGAGTPDEIVRYVMVVKTAGGAINTSYEGIRCDTNEYRIYATGTRDGTWSKSRITEWRKFQPYNQQQKSLANFYFCPEFHAIKTAEEGLDALRRGMHPAVAAKYAQ
ncbi:MAG: CNP1-like family protein [Rhodocyclaceae bacterium]|nr:CNP1-like family protein [Rhodocyclaceae bacterium]